MILFLHRESLRCVLLNAVYFSTLLLLQLLRRRRLLLLLLLLQLLSVIHENTTTNMFPEFILSSNTVCINSLMTAPALPAEAAEYTFISSAERPADCNN